ncbi:MAG: Mur ligase family protein [Balneolaceae bacterium]
MYKFDHIQDVYKYLDSVPMFGKNGQSAANFDLDRMKYLCSVMGHPENTFKSIHVAGTNGKGTVCRMLASIYQEAGFKTGLYTSPHLEHVTERFRVNSEVIHPNDLLIFFQQYGNEIIKASATYFEITTAISFWYFSIQKVDIAIIETGLGGRLDATNVLQPMASVITSISLDHADILGNQIVQIATEKGGIIKYKTPVFTGILPFEAKNRIRDIALSQESDLIEVSGNEFEYHSGEIRVTSNEKKFRIKGEHFKSIDAQNAQLVLDIVEYFNKQFSVSASQLFQGLKSMHFRYPQRAIFEKLIPDQRWFFDGAHNTESVTILAQHLKNIGPVDEWILILSYMSDKMNDEIATIWNEFPNIYLYEMQSVRAAKMDEMKKYFPSAMDLKMDQLNLLNDFESRLVIFSGSFYFYGTVRRWLGTMIAAKDNLSAQKTDPQA